MTKQHTRISGDPLPPYMIETHYWRHARDALEAHRLEAHENLGGQSRCASLEAHEVISLEARWGHLLDNDVSH
jgi:hypothetical protein